jgi:hypothetical protein
MVLGGTPVLDLKQTVPPFFMIHIGKLIEEEMKRQERTPVWLAKKINCERPNVYYIFRQESINTDLLLRISRALNHNFFLHYLKAYEE